MRYHGAIGYADSVETPEGSGIWEDVITERTYTGDVIRNTRRLESGESVNDDVVVNNNISVVADDEAIKHFFKIRYIVWAGVYWSVTSVEVKHPRLILTLGNVYNGPKA